MTGSAKKKKGKKLTAAKLRADEHAWQLRRDGECSEHFLLRLREMAQQKVLSSAL